MKCYDVRTNSCKLYHKEHMMKSVEKMHVDVGAERVNIPRFRISFVFLALEASIF